MTVCTYCEPPRYYCPCHAPDPPAQPPDNCTGKDAGCAWRSGRHAPDCPGEIAVAKREAYRECMLRLAECMTEASGTGNNKVFGELYLEFRKLAGEE